jgi:hypothetical protein
MTTMRAVRAHKRSGPEQLVDENAPRPEPAAGEVLGSMNAASITNGELAWEATWTDSLSVGRRGVRADPPFPWTCWR